MGWSATLEAALDRLGLPDVVAARVVRVDRLSVRVLGVDGERTAHLPGKVRHEADRPAVGDWVAVEPLPGEDKAMVRGLLPRRTEFRRKVAGRTTEAQVVAANIDVLFLVSSLDRDFNVRRLERYVTLGWESGAQPVVVLNKADLHDDVDRCVAQAELSAPGVSVHAVSAARGEGIEAVASHLAPGRTGAFLGSSGVGKSTLVNALCGSERMRTQSSREHDQRGRHTTTHRELVPIPGGAMLIDTPGMRELSLWGEGDGLDDGFADVAAAAATCRFSDCTHGTEPDCGVWAAIGAGTLEAERLEHYQKLQRELAFLKRSQSEREKRAANRKLGAYYRKVQNAKRREKGW